MDMEVLHYCKHVCHSKQGFVLHSHGGFFESFTMPYKHSPQSRLVDQETIW